MGQDKPQSILYVITGISRLTGEREVISGRHTESATLEMLLKWKDRFHRQRRPAYTRLKMEPAAREGSLW